MTSNAHALISLEDRFAEGILNGTKLVELRRRSMSIEPGTTVWFYVKVPVGKVIGSAQVQSTHSLAPSTLWRRYGDVFDYFAGLARAFALVLNQPKRLEAGVSLQVLRGLNGSFQPPQFFQHLAEDGPLVSAFLGEPFGSNVRLPAQKHRTTDSFTACA
jgi:predicted transcriptional regulator